MVNTPQSTEYISGVSLATFYEQKFRKIPCTKDTFVVCAGAIRQVRSSIVVDTPTCFWQEKKLNVTVAA